MHWIHPKTEKQACNERIVMRKTWRIARDLLKGALKMNVEPGSCGFSTIDWTTYASEEKRIGREPSRQAWRWKSKEKSLGSCRYDGCQVKGRLSSRIYSTISLDKFDAINQHYFLIPPSTALYTLPPVSRILRFLFLHFIICPTIPATAKKPNPS